MKSPQHVSLEEDDDYISTVYSRERLSQLVDFLRDNTSGQLQIEVIKFADALSESQIETASKTNFKHNLIERSYDACVMCICFPYREDIWLLCQDIVFLVSVLIVWVVFCTWSAAATVILDQHGAVKLLALYSHVVKVSVCVG
jgi:hypothetical protein